jgi:hypothetical protein
MGEAWGPSNKTMLFLPPSPKATRDFEPVSNRGVLLSTLLHATLYFFLHNLLNVLVQLANKMRLQRKYLPPRNKVYLASPTTSLRHVLFFLREKDEKVGGGVVRDTTVLEGGGVIETEFGCLEGSQAVKMLERL